MEKLSGISEVIIICMGSALNFKREGKSSVWIGNDQRCILTSQLLKTIELYNQFGNATIINIADEDVGSSAPLVDIEFEFDPFPAECFEVRMEKDYPLNHALSGFTFWRSSQARKGWNRKVQNAEGSWITVGEEISNEQLLNLMASQREYVLHQGWRWKFYSSTCEELKINFN